MKPARLASGVATAAAIAYPVISYLNFKLPQSVAEGEACGFTDADFNAMGQLAYPPLQAWWVSFVHQQEYWTLVSVCAALAFAGFALAVGRQAGRGLATGAAAGGGVLAVSALCVSCLAPVLSAVGLGLGASLLVGVPKWLIALNTLLLTGWGAMILSRRQLSCKLPADAGKSTNPIPETR